MTIPVLEPASAHEAATLLMEAARDGRTLLPRGGGTKLAWHVSPAGADVVLSTSRLRDAIVHDAGDLVATFPAGVTLAEANRVLASAGQWLALDPPYSERATIGGITAANDSGPRRFRYGAPRDLILGVETALTDGRVAKAGGRVVKNVAGYDLSRLMCGSFGQLAVITSVTFKLAPLPPCSRTIVATFATGAAAVVAACDLAHAHVTPSAIEIAAPAPRLLVRFESTVRAADQMASETATRFRDAARSIEIVRGDDEAALWRDHEDLWRSIDGTLVRFSMLPTECAEALNMLEEAADSWMLVGRAALGTYAVRLVGPVAAQQQLLASLSRITAKRGHLSTLDGPLHKGGGDAAAFGDALPVMRAVKQQFDPQGALPSHAALGLREVAS